MNFYGDVWISPVNVLCIPGKCRAAREKNTGHSVQCEGISGGFVSRGTTVTRPGARNIRCVPVTPGA